MATKRRWRRLLAVLLTLALMCSLSVQAFAAALPADAGTAEEETVSADMKAAFRCPDGAAEGRRPGQGRSG